MKALFALALLLAAARPALAASIDTEPSSLAIPPQSTAEASSASTTSGHSFALGVGTGINTFGGNLGKLYNSSSPVVDVRGQFALSSKFVLRAGGEFASYAFNAAPNGAVNVNTSAIAAAAEWHFLSTALSGAGFDPYGLVGGAQVFRSQSFEDHNSVEKDNAAAVNAGIGANYLLHGGNLGFWAEADAGQVFFQDRYDQEYLESGLSNLTGPLYSARVGVKYVF
jgi:hypothetical protein